MTNDQQLLGWHTKYIPAAERSVGQKISKSNIPPVDGERGVGVCFCKRIQTLVQNSCPPG